MNTYKYTVRLEVEVEAFESGDAFDILQDSFGIGETGAATVTRCDYEEQGVKK